MNEAMIKTGILIVDIYREEKHCSGNAESQEKQNPKFMFDVYHVLSPFRTVIFISGII